MTSQPNTPGVPADLPLGMALMPMNPAWQENPYRLLDQLREAGRLIFDPAFQRYIVTGYRDVEAVLHDRDLAVDPRKAAENSFNRQVRATRMAADDRRPSMLFLDPPEHTRLRALVQKAFTPRAVERMAPRVEEIANALLDAVEAEPSWDFMAAFAMQLPTIVIAEMLGVNPADRADFKRWSDTVVAAGFDPFATDEMRERAARAGEEFDAYVRRAIAERRAAPRDDLITGMIHAEEAGDFLDDEEILSMIRLLLTAGNVTTTDLMGNGLLALLTYRGQWEKLVADPTLIANTIEEMLRWDPPVTMSGRITQGDRVIAGCPVAHGQSLTVALGAANFDPEVHKDPWTFDITRDDPHHVSFGGGRRYCLGSSLARLEATAGIGTLVKRFPSLRLVEQEITRKRVPGFRGLERLLVTARPSSPGA